MEQPADEPHAMGENLGVDMGRPVARQANSRVSSSGENTYMPAEELGEPRAKDVRFRDSAKQGFLTAYVRTHEFTEEHKTLTRITVSTIAIGAVITAISHLQHRKK